MAFEQKKRQDNLALTVQSKNCRVKTAKYRGKKGLK